MHPHCLHVHHHCLYACCLSGDHAEKVLDQNDPNYDSEEEQQVVVLKQHDKVKTAIVAYKREVRLQACERGS